MNDTSRRRLLRASSAVAIGPLAGCLAESKLSSTESPVSPDEETADPTSLTDWERSTDCDGMHDSVVRVERVTTSLGDEYAPIHFENLSPGEKEILRTVTEDGGYGTCDTSDAFDRFVGRVAEHTDQQDGDGMRVYLERESTFYGLYVEDLDEVYAY